MERMLQETGKQLTGIAGEVEAADRKIARCAADIVDVLDRCHLITSPFFIKSSSLHPQAGKQ